MGHNQKGTTLEPLGSSSLVQPQESQSNMSASLRDEYLDPKSMLSNARPFGRVL